MRSGPTYSYRGIDNPTYYLLHDDRRRYATTPGPATSCTPRTPPCGGWWWTACASGRARCASTGSGSIWRRSSPGAATGPSTWTTRRSSRQSARIRDLADAAADRRGRGTSGATSWGGAFRASAGSSGTTGSATKCALRAGRPGHRGEPDDAALWQLRSVSGRPARRVSPVPERQFHHRPRRVLPVRPGRRTTRSTMSPTAGRTPTAATTTSAGTAATRATRARPRKSWRFGGSR